MCCVVAERLGALDLSSDGVCDQRSAGSSPDRFTYSTTIAYFSFVYVACPALVGLSVSLMVSYFLPIVVVVFKWCFLLIVTEHSLDGHVLVCLHCQIIK